MRVAGLQYETWWVVHLYTYLALALAFAHQIVTGGAFIGHPLTRASGCAVVATAGVVIACRIVIPVVRNLRFRLRVVSVHQEAPGVYSLVCSGRGLSRLAVSGGQFFSGDSSPRACGGMRIPTHSLLFPSRPFSG